MWLLSPALMVSSAKTLMISLPVLLPAVAAPTALTDLSFVSVPLSLQAFAKADVYGYFSDCFISLLWSAGAIVLLFH